jgi:hypothetical protein
MTTLRFDPIARDLDDHEAGGITFGQRPAQSLGKVMASCFQP